jgi:hypothetical protein
LTSAAKTSKISHKFRGAPLYHGTSYKKAEQIIKFGFEKPVHLRNWLGGGVYFSVDNFILPATYALRQAQDDQSTPVIIKIENPKWEDYEGRILDLTSDWGILQLYTISKEFSEIIDPRNIENIEDLRNSPIYDSQLKFDISISLHVFSCLIRNILNFMEEQRLLINEPIVGQLVELSKVKLFCILIDWYNYYKSGGNPDKVPFKAVISIFNAGDPVLLRASGLWIKDFRRFRTFYDQVNFLQRIEVSFLLFDYYTNQSRVPIEQIGEYKIETVTQLIGNNLVLDIIKEQEDEL